MMIKNCCCCFFFLNSTKSTEMFLVQKNICNFFGTIEIWPCQSGKSGFSRFLYDCYGFQSKTFQNFSIFQYKRGRVGLRQILGLRKIVEDIFFVKFGLVRVANQVFRGSYTIFMVFRAKFCKKKIFDFSVQKLYFLVHFRKNVQKCTKTCQNVHKMYKNVESYKNRSKKLRKNSL